MIKNLFKKSSLLLAALCISAQAYAADAVIKFKTELPAGEEMRISAYPYDVTVEGATQSDYAMMYVSPGPDQEITVTGPLEQLEIFRCGITELSVSSADALTILRCYENNIPALDLTQAPNLEVLDCHSNNLAVLDLTAAAALYEINASANKLESVNLGTKAALRNLYLADNLLPTIDLTGCSGVEQLYVNGNQLTSLDLSKCTRLGWVRAFGNKITGEQMDALANTIPAPVAAIPGMFYVVDTRNENEGNVCLMKNVEAFRNAGWVTCDYSGGIQSSGMIGTFYRGADYVPTVADNKIIITTTRSAGETVKLKLAASGDITIEGVKETVVSGESDYTLTGSTITLSGAVTTLECKNDDVTEITFEGEISLVNFDCSGNAIRNLDLTGAGALTIFNCNDNALTTLSVEGCTALNNIHCFNNSLRGSHMTDFVNTLPLRDGSYLFVIDTTSDKERNIASTTDVNIATGKDWLVRDWINGGSYGMGQKYEGTEPAEILPDEYVTFASNAGSETMITFAFNEADDYTPALADAELMSWNGQSLGLRIESGKPFTVYGNATEVSAVLAGITFADFSHLPELSVLTLSFNELDEVSLTSGNPKLKTLALNDNHLTALDLSPLGKSTDYILVQMNEIKGDAMTAMMNSLPDRTGLTTGAIVAVSAYEDEQNVCLTSDVDVAHSRNWQVYKQVGNQLEVYAGAAGIDAPEAAAAVSYDALTAVISLSEASDIEVYTVAGALAASFRNTDSASIASLAKGVYVIRAGSAVLKVIR